MRHTSSFAILVLLGWFSTGVGDIGSPPTRLAPWTIPGEVATLPSPFWEIRIIFETSQESAVRFEISVAGNLLKVDEALFEDLENPDLVEITYSDPAQTLSGKIEYFELLILTGKPYPVRHLPCDQPRAESMERDIAVIRVSRDLNVSRRTVSFRSLDECET